MRLERPASLGKTVEATTTNRPIKIAYVVPIVESTITHLILDAVFFESYTRWAGMYTLIVPATAQGFIAAEYEAWLQRYDPDFVYSYIELEAAFVDSIDRLCCPIAFLRHQERESEESELRWRDFLPRWDHYFRPISSLTTLSSPASYSHYRHEVRSAEPTVLTQFQRQPRDRFIADNFGTGFSVTNVTHAISGFFRTLCLVPPNLPSQAVAGSERCQSAVEAFRAITDRKVISIAKLAMVHSEGVPRPEAQNWTSAFHIFLGSAASDRVHFWNCRHLGSNWSETPIALIVGTDLIENDLLVTQLGQYLNKHNFLGRSGGQYEVEIHSSSIPQDGLRAFREKLAPQTWNSIRINENPGVISVPTANDLRWHTHVRTSNPTTLKLTENSSELVASEPEHFTFVPPQLKTFTRGQWIVELDIQRHNNLAQYSSVVDSWNLPQRLKVVRALTSQLAKPTRQGRLALMPAPPGFPFERRDLPSASHYEVRLPSDATFFRHLVLDFFQYPGDDLRATNPAVGYKDMAISDKGQNLRGVVSLFGELSRASSILSHRFWRDVLEMAEDDSTKPRQFSFEELQRLFPRDKETIRRLAKELNFDRPDDAKSYINASLRDTLEYLVRSNVFYMVAPWRCTYCGHANSRNFDNMRLKNHCDICGTEFLPLIDMKWQYELNAFVYRSMKRHGGLPVLWALGQLQESTHTGAFWYLPEVDLYDEHEEPTKKNEIDILCIRNGEFVVAEVKKSATTFLNDPDAVSTFAKIVDALRPDVAQLVFFRYCASDAEEVATKDRLRDVVNGLRERIGRWVRLEVVVAQDGTSFQEYSADLGWHGPRTRHVGARGG